MMKLAVISDIHGNDLALEAVLDDLAQQGGADVTWCLGDLALFGARPSACIQRIRALSEADKSFKVIGGNTDRYLLTGERFPSPPVDTPEAFSAYKEQLPVRDLLHNWTLAQLSWDDYQFLRKINQGELSLEVAQYGWVIGYHAVPGNDEAMLTPESTDEEAADYLLDREGRLGIGGHIHRQMNREVGHWRLVNVGSVGLSFDAPSFAQYGIFTFDDDGALTVTLRQVPYDIEALAATLDAVGYPSPEWVMQRVRPAAI